MSDSPYLTAKEAARYARVSYRTIVKHVTHGTLRAARLGGWEARHGQRRGELRFRREWVDAWLQALAGGHG